MMQHHRLSSAAYMSMACRISACCWLLNALKASFDQKPNQTISERVPKTMSMSFGQFRVNLNTIRSDPCLVC